MPIRQQSMLCPWILHFMTIGHVWVEHGAVYSAHTVLVHKPLKCVNRSYRVVVGQVAV